MCRPIVLNEHFVSVGWLAGWSIGRATDGRMDVVLTVALLLTLYAQFNTNRMSAYSQNIM